MTQTTAIHISQSSIRIMSGGFGNTGKLKIQKTAYMSGAAQYFLKNELFYVRELVRDIVETMHDAHISCKRIALCYDNNIEVNWIEAQVMPKFQPQKQMGELLKKLKSKKEKENDRPHEAMYQKGVIQKQQHWGEFVTSDRSGAMKSDVTVDRDLILVLVQEFAEYGFTVKSIEPPTTAVMYLRHSIPYSYDNMGQLLLMVDGSLNEVGTYTFIKNTPSKTVTRILPLSVDDDALGENLVEIYDNEVLADRLRRPIVILGGDGLRSYETYKIVTQKLERKGYIVYDLYDYFPNNIKESIEIEIADKLQNPDCCGLFTICIALLFRSMDSKPENLIDSKVKVTPSATALVVPTSAMVSMGALLLCSLVLLGVRGYSLLSTNELLKDTTIQNNELVAVQNLHSLEKDKLNVMTHMDERFVSVLHFVAGNISAEINVVSVDTVNIIPVSSVGDSVFEETEVDEQDGEEVEQTATMELPVKEKIIIRGFATQSIAPVEFYNELVAEMIGDTELVGVKQIELLNDEIMYAFEIAVKAR